MDTADTEQRPSFSSGSEAWLVRGGGIDIIVDQPLQTEEMILNIGPQHPSTHGVLRVVLELDGERIVRAETGDRLHAPRRGEAGRVPRHQAGPGAHEPARLAVGVQQRARVGDRDGAHAGIEVPERAQWIRTMLAEWNRILNHLMFCGSFPLELGAMTPMFYAFREREMIQDLMESATGARMHHSFVRIGGLKDDLPRGSSGSRATSWLGRAKLRDFEQLVMGNEIIFARTKGIGVLSADRAVPTGTSGRCCRRAVSRWTRARTTVREVRRGRLRRPIGATGDSYDRLWVLVQRMWESCKIIEQCMEKLPAGDFIAPKLPKTDQGAEGEIYVRTENPLGLMGYYVVGDEQEQPYRLKMRTASFSNVSVIRHCCRARSCPTDRGPREHLLRRRRRRPVVRPLSLPVPSGAASIPSSTCRPERRR
jgi:NADH-quinone oxidoreductase subunit D